MSTDERGPGGDRDRVQTPAQEVTPNPTRASDWQALADSMRGAFVVLVESPGATYRRRVYLSLKSAERAVDRAHARGCMAHVALCRLLPVANIAPGQVVDGGS